MTADDTTIRAAAEVIAAHVGKPANGGTASGAWVDCACLAEAKGVSRDHATSLHRKHVARALDADGLLATPKRDAEVAAEALRGAAEGLAAATEGEGRVGTSTWRSETARDAYSLAVEESVAALHARADRIEREGGRDA